MRRVTALLSSARRADAQGEYQQARELYSEVLKVQRSLANAPLGSIGKSLRDVAAGVETRLQHLRQELRDGGDGVTTAASRSSASASTASSSSAKHAGSVSNLNSSRGAALADIRDPPRAGAWSVRPGSNGSQLFSTGFLPECATASSWDTSGMGSCPASARDGCGGRPTTRDGSVRPCTQDGARRPSTKDARRQHGHESARPATRDAASRGDDISRPPQTPLDGVRPCTREDARLQQMITGSSHRHSARGEGGGNSSRPQTKDAARPPARSGVSERRCQDVSIRQLSGKGKRNRQGSEASGTDAAVAPPSRDASPSPLPTSRTPESLSGGDEVVDLT